MESFQKCRALLATARIANVPSVLSNLAVGMILGWAGGRDWPWLLWVAGVLFYVSGNFFNDWADRGWDAKHRPERALPSGMFGAGLYLGVGVVGMLVGLGLCAIYGVWVSVVGVILCGLILLYTWVHKRVAWGVIPMGLCRAGLPVMGYVGVSRGVDWVVIFPALGLLFYVMGLSMSARNEARGGGDGGLGSGVLLWGSGLVAVVLPMMWVPWWGWVGMVPFGIWLVLGMGRYRSPVSAHVSWLLAGIPLVDWVVMLPMGVMCFGSVEGWVAIMLAPVCVCTGRVLQRVAAAT